MVRQGTGEQGNGAGPGALRGSGAGAQWRGDREQGTGNRDWDMDRDMEIYINSGIAVYVGRATGCIQYIVYSILHTAYSI
jgi:hypothetical protein